MVFKELELYLQTNQKYNCFLFGCQWTCQIVNIAYKGKLQNLSMAEFMYICELPIGGHYMIEKATSKYPHNETNEVKR